MSVRSPPIASTMPQGSCPVMKGRESPPPSGPCQRWTSVPQRVEASIRTSSDPGCNSGIGTRRISSGLLYAVMTAARQSAMVCSFVILGVVWVSYIASPARRNEMPGTIDADTHVVEPEEMWGFFDKAQWQRRPIAVPYQDPETGRGRNYWMIDGNLVPKP